MKGKALIFRPDNPYPETQELTGHDSKFLHDTVGGYIELVPYFNTIIADKEEGVVYCCAFANEDGKRLELPPNTVATALWDLALRRIHKNETALYPTGLIGPDGSLADYLCGTILVLTGDDEFMEDL